MKRLGFSLQEVAFNTLYFKHKDGLILEFKSENEIRIYDGNITDTIFRGVVKTEKAFKKLWSQLISV